MKKTVFTILLSTIILASSIVGCTINKANREETMDSTTELECLVKKGKLLCGTEVGYYPMEFYDDSGTAVWTLMLQTRLENALDWKSRLSILLGKVFFQDLTQDAMT